jgi:hypothetical protein
MTQPDEKPPEMSPLIAWFSRHGVKAVGGLLLIELVFHAYAVLSSKR